MKIKNLMTQIKILKELEMSFSDIVSYLLAEGRIEYETTEKEAD